MPLFTKDNIRILFISIPKTMGTSIVKELEKTFTYHFMFNDILTNDLNIYYICEKQLNQLHPSHQYYRMYNAVDYDQSFTIVRNPYDRIVSYYYFYLKQNPNISIDMTKFIISQIDSKHFTTQYEYIKDGKQDITILKFEEPDKIQEYLTNIDSSIKLLHENKIKHKHWKEELSDLDIVMVNKIYAIDFEKFGYEMIIP